MLRPARLAVAALLLGTLVARWSQVAPDLDHRLVDYLSYLTVLSNTAGAVLLGVQGIRGRAASPGIRGAVTACLVGVGLTDSVVLGVLAPSPATFVDVVLHVVGPAAVLLDWIVDHPVGAVGARTAASWLVAPLGYLAVTTVRGAVTGWYPYPFLDPTVVGGPGAVALLVGLFALVLLASALLLTALTNRLADRHRDRRQTPTSALRWAATYRSDVRSGSAMGPVLWWWRWWLGDDEGRQQTTKVEGLLDEQRQQTAELMEQLQGRDRELAELRDVSERLQRANDEASETRAGLVAQLDQATAEAAELRSAADELERARAEVDRLQARVDELEPQVAKIDGLRQRIAELEEAAALTTALDSGDTATASDGAADDGAADTADGAADTADEASDAEASDAEADLDAAAEVLGGNVEMDDLTVIDGVGPKIAGVLTDAGIDSWRTLADTEVDRLREVLAEAGPRYRNRDPSDWPAQGALLADGRWQEFKTRTSG